MAIMEIVRDVVRHAELRRSRLLAIHKARQFRKEVRRCPDPTEEIVEIDEFIRRMGILVRKPEPEENSV